jgi:hypothetical protein
LGGVDSETWWELTSSPPSPHLSGIEANWKWPWGSVPSWFENWNHTESLKKNWFQFQICCGLVRFEPCTSKSESSYSLNCLNFETKVLSQIMLLIIFLSYTSKFLFTLVS